MRETKKMVSLQLLISMFLFCSVIVVLTFSPLAQYRNGTNHIGSIGMWVAILVTIIAYGTLLFLNRMTGRLFRIALAIGLGLAVFIDASIVIANALSSYFMETYNWASLMVIVINILAITIKMSSIIILTKKKPADSQSNSAFIYKS